MPLVREGHKRKIDGVEHQLNGHENSNQIALDEEAHNAQRKQRRAQQQIPGEGNILREEEFICRPSFLGFASAISVAMAGQRNRAKNGNEDRAPM